VDLQVYTLLQTANARDEVELLLSILVEQTLSLDLALPNQLENGVL
jgi:hypothetical protein